MLSEDDFKLAEATLRMKGFGFDDLAKIWTLVIQDVGDHYLTSESAGAFEADHLRQLVNDYRIAWNNHVCFE